MAGPVLYDAVTLRHFAIAGQLDVLEVRHGHLAPPRWTDVVHTEISDGAALGNAECNDVLAMPWLAAPIVPTAPDQPQIMPIWIGLNSGRRSPTEHAGEAESIYFAEKLGGVFATDDNSAYDFAEHRLGAAGVLDSVDILQQAVSMAEVTADDALAIANEIRAKGRYLRSVHPDTLTAAYFN